MGCDLVASVVDWWLSRAYAVSVLWECQVWGGGGLMTLEGVYDKLRALINRWIDLANRNFKQFQL